MSVNMNIIGSHGNGLVFLKDIEKLESEQLNFCITVPANQTTWVIVNDARFKFQYDYFAEKVIFITQTNASVKALLKFNERIFPTRNFIITSSVKKEDNNPESNIDMGVFYMQQAWATEYPLNLYLENEWSFEVYNINSHTSEQKVWILIHGYKIYRKKENIYDFNKKGSD